MPFSDDLSVIAQAMVDLLEETNAPVEVDGDPTFPNQLEPALKKVYFGDEQMIDKTPAVSVRPDNVEKELVETGMTTRNTFSVELIVYHTSLKGATVRRKEVLEYAESVASVVNDDLTLGGLVVVGYIRRIEPGFMRRGNNVMVATRMAWEGFNKTRLGG